MHKLFFLSALIFPLFIACEEESPIPALENESAVISFDAAVVGQQSIYLAYESHNDRSNGPTPLTYTGDTLWLTITGLSANVLEVEAKYSQTAETDQYRITVQNTVINISQAPGNAGNSLFIESSFLPLSLPLTVIASPVLPINFADLSENCFANTCLGSIVNHEQLGNTYARLNLSANYADMAFDGSGKYILYSKEEGIVRSTAVSAWTQDEWGWDLLQ